MKNKVAFVTGAGSGIGRATALAYAQRNTRVAVVDYSEEGAWETLRQIREKSDVPAEAFICDVTIEEEVRSAVLKTIDVLGPITEAFNNAGTEGEPGSLCSCTDENWDGVFNINLRGIWLCMKYQLDQMAKNGGGAVVNCSSIAGVTGFANMAPYVASKHAVLGLTKVAALEYAKYNVRVNAICPGFIDTPMLARYAKHFHVSKEKMAEGTPMGRLGTPLEIAQAVVWLNSPEASFVTGHAFVADGGWVIQ